MDRIVAVGLLTQRDIDVLGQAFKSYWPVDETPCFSQLLQAIDEADREMWRDRDRAGEIEKPLTALPRIPER